MFRPQQVVTALLFAVPIAAASIITGTQAWPTSPDSQFRVDSSAGSLTTLHREGGELTGWIRLRLAPHVAVVPQAALSNGEPLFCWLTTEDGAQWLNIGGGGNRLHQPKKFVWPTGTHVAVTLPGTTQISDWTLFREDGPPDSQGQERRRTTKAVVSAVLLLLSSAVALLSTSAGHEPSGVTAQDHIRLLISSFDGGTDRREARRMRAFLRAVVLNGSTVTDALDCVSGTAVQRKLFALRTIG